MRIPGGVGNFNFAWVRWGFKPNLLIISSEINVLSFNMEVFQGKKFFFASRWLRKKVYKKVTVADLAFYKKKKQNKTNKKKTDDQIRLLGKAFEQNFTTNQSSKVQMPQGLLEGKLKRRIDWRISARVKKQFNAAMRINFFHFLENLGLLSLQTS